MSRIELNDLKSYLWQSAVLLRNHIDAGNYKQYIFPLLFYKRMCDVYDEEFEIALNESGGNEEYASFEENHRFLIPSSASWRKLREQSNNIGKFIQTALRQIEKANYEKLNGVFGNAPWTNKSRLPDELLKDLIEHFSGKLLNNTNLPEDELGIGYEYLIRKFADDSGHTAQEFYTNRTVVHLMTEMLEPKTNESIYDPTCGSAGMLISAITHLKESNQEWRNVRLFGQEINSLTSSIARMNLFLHGVQNFEVVNDDTLDFPGFLDGNQLMKFDLVLANPPYSIKQWNRKAFSTDKYGRNILGTPPQGRADFAFIQHILTSLSAKKGRAAILLPHGILFRNEEWDMRKKLIELDLIETVIGLGPNLFFNSPMEACILICKSSKEEGRKGVIQFINAINEVTRTSNNSFLDIQHIEKISSVYKDYKDDDDFSKIVSVSEISKNDFSLNIPLYFETTNIEELLNTKNLIKEFSEVAENLSFEITQVLKSIDKELE